MCILWLFKEDRMRIMCPDCKGLMQFECMVLKSDGVWIDENYGSGIRIDAFEFDGQDWFCRGDVKIH